MKVNIKKRRKAPRRETDRESRRIGTIVISLIAAGIIFVVLMSMEKDMLSSYEKGQVVVAKINIPNGTIITDDNMQTYLKRIEAEKSIIPAAAFTDISELKGLMFPNGMDKDGFVTISSTKDVLERIKGMKEPVIAGIRGADISQVACGTIRAGDMIHIFITENDTKTVVQAFEDVFVTQAFDAAGTEIKNEDRISSAQVLNIIFEKEQVEQLYTELAKGTMQVVREY